MRMLSHENILTVVDSFSDGEEIFIVTEKCME